jgi:hypothetical protein
VGLLGPGLPGKSGPVRPFHGKLKGSLRAGSVKENRRNRSAEVVISAPGVVAEVQGADMEFYFGLADAEKRRVPL